jgi:hypothetical protein
MAEAPKRTLHPAADAESTRACGGGGWGSHVDLAALGRRGDRSDF